MSDLSEVILARVLGWSAEDVATERPYLQAMAMYKYDEYQQFQPGMRFFESLALWLQQFRTAEERRTAYEFVKSRLVFISRSEMEHLVASAYPDYIRKIILSEAAAGAGLPPHRVAQAAAHSSFRVTLRRSLFLGLSDGAHTDIFRRRNGGRISHEQVYQTYEITAGRAKAMLRELSRDLCGLSERDAPKPDKRFQMAFLLDDFSGSGRTYLREDSGTFKGKIAKLHEQAAIPGSPLNMLLDLRDARVYVVLYVCTVQARQHLESMLPRLWGGSGPVPQVVTVHELKGNSKLCDPKDADFLSLCRTDEYYHAERLEDRSTLVGGSDVRLGFAQCCLPLVLSHNTPNNSVALLWAYETANVHGLFPRVPRHREVAI